MERKEKKLKLDLKTIKNIIKSPEVKKGLKDLGKSLKELQDTWDVNK